jgi:threonine dehydrogenase-like Zn-dependent dehydrogenase
VVGVVTEVGQEGDSGLIGRKVVALLPNAGGYAEFAIAPAIMTIPLTNDTDDLMMAALPTQGVTAYLMLRSSTQLRSGESVLVHGAGGGVGSVAVQIAKSLGAGMVIATAASEEKRELARRMGADAAVNYDAPGDIASLKGEDVDWRNGTVSFTRKKTGVPVVVHLGNEALNLLKDLPAEGPLFPYWSRVRAGDRATEFASRCRQLGIVGVTLHSYRYAWAERAKTVGYPERFAQEALGHNSKAVHRAYAKRALMKIPSLEDYELRAAVKIEPAA